MTGLAGGRLFPTLAVGSLPRDQWVVDVVNARNDGRIDSNEADRLLDGAVLSAVRMQEQAGLDFVSDGEWRRNSYLRVFFDAVNGYEPDIMPPRRFSTAPLPAIVAPIVQHRSLQAASDAAFLKENTGARTIATLPGPYTVGGRMWTADHSAPAYASPAEGMAACVPIINAEVRALAELGVDMIQIDEPWLGDVPNPEYRESEGIVDLERELELYVDGINGAVEGVDVVPLSVHVCGHTSPTTPDSRGWPFEKLFEALGRMNVDRFTVAMAGPNLDGFGTLKDFPKDKVLGLGVLGTLEHETETEGPIVDRVERAMEYVPKERITLNSDCGFAPSKRNRRDLDEVYTRLKTMCLAADTLRAKYG